MGGIELLAGAAVLGAVAVLLLRTRKGRPTMNVTPTLPANAQIVDVRSPGEFRMGHAPNSLNIPLGALPQRLGDLDPTRPVVLCCATGARSSAARALLSKNGFAEVHDVGPWQTLL